jgi:hypothetical protein
MTSATVPVTGYPVVPYLTVAELKRSPIYTQLQNLVPGGSAADNDAELNQIIKRVSAMINGECRQNLAASINEESGWCTVTSRGELRIHALNNPIIQVLEVSVGLDESCLTPLTDLSGVVLRPWRITVPARAYPLYPPAGYRVWAQWKYVNGYPVTVLAQPVAVGDTALTILDATGVVAGKTTLTIEDGKWQENITPTAVSGNTLTVPPLAFAHQPGVGINALPYDIQEAALILISRLHNTWSLSMGAITHDGTGARKNPNAQGTGARFLCDPGVILEPYKRVWF